MKKDKVRNYYIVPKVVMEGDKLVVVQSATELVTATGIVVTNQIKRLELHGKQNSSEYRSLVAANHEAPGNYKIHTATSKSEWKSEVFQKYMERVKNGQ